MAQPLRVPAALPQDSGSIPSPHIWQVTTVCNSAPGDPTASSGACGHKANSWYTDIDTGKSTYTQKLKFKNPKIYLCKTSGLVITPMCFTTGNYRWHAIIYHYVVVFHLCFIINLILKNKLQIIFLFRSLIWVYHKKKIWVYLRPPPAPIPYVLRVLEPKRA